MELVFKAEPVAKFYKAFAKATKAMTLHAPDSTTCGEGALPAQTFPNTFPKAFLGKRGARVNSGRTIKLLT